MRRRIGLIIFVLIVAALFMAENAVAQIKCKTVEVHMSDYWEFAGIDLCGEEGWCSEARFIGTLNGLFFGSGLDSDIEYPTFGDSHVWKGTYTFETKQGEIFTTATGHSYWQTFYLGTGTNQETHVITGGTGHYEGASGFLFMYYEFPLPDFFPATGEMSGQICRPEE
jgi:hypothetical protein